MEKVLQVDIEKCSGCRTCEAVCSLKNTGECNPTQSRIRVIRYEKHGEFHNFIPMVCQQCSNALCMEACPVNAISRDHETGALIVDAQTCVGCKVCSMVCPIGGVSMEPITNVAYKCDLCGGDPTCVRFCDPSALQFVPAASVNLMKKRDAGLKLSEVMRKSFAKG